MLNFNITKTLPKNISTHSVVFIESEIINKMSRQTSGMFLYLNLLQQGMFEK